MFIRMFDLKLHVKYILIGHLEVFEVTLICGDRLQRSAFLEMIQRFWFNHLLQKTIIELIFIDCLYINMI
jgi:hypothetical protein